jgi:1,2-diacylglycerol 3-beta-galactosyltransferase
MAAGVTTGRPRMRMLEGMPPAGPSVAALAGPAGAVPLLFLLSDTGGGHRNAARAVGQALDRLYPGGFAPVFWDPLRGPGSPRALRWVTGLYGPVTRLAPWLWGAAYHACDSRPAMWLLRWTLLRRAWRPVTGAALALRPAAIVSFHPLTGAVAVAARDRSAPGVPVVTVVTDLGRVHAAWRHRGADLLIGPRPHPGVQGSRDGPGGWVAAGLPVTEDFWHGPLLPGERALLRRSLGLRDGRFLVLVTGGGEGSGGMARRTAAILRRFADVDVVAVCGRNRGLERRLGRLAAASGGRLRVSGFVRNMADWLRCCDLVVTKAGPGTIAEATCCGAPLLVASHLPGQESRNAEFVSRAGAGRHARSVRRLLAEIGSLRGDQERMRVMRAASARLGQPGAAADIAGLIAGAAGIGRARAGGPRAETAAGRAGSC